MHGQAAQYADSESTHPTSHDFVDWKVRGKSRSADDVTTRGVLAALLNTEHTCLTTLPT